MDRKWRMNRGAIDTVLSFPAFREHMQPWRADYDLASLTDLYAMYTVLHIERKGWELRWSDDGGFYFFVAKETLPAPGQAAAAAVPEGDEDMPAAMTESEMGEGDQRRGSTANVLDQDDDGGGSGEEEEDAGAAEGSGGGAAEPAAPAAAPPPPPPPAGEPSVRTQILIPVSSAYPHLTPALLQRFFSIRGVQAQQVILGLVDSNGVVTRSCMYNYIQDPLEGPGTANVELLDD